MTVANVSQTNVSGLPKELITAQEAIHFPEVQEMLRKLSEYNLGIYMPHMHDEQTGQFQLLPEEVLQVESGLEVSFRSSVEIGNQLDRFLPVGWFWRENALTPLGYCHTVCEKQGTDTQHYRVEKT